MVNKFAHVTGGADRYCLAVAEQLRARGHEVQFLSTASELNVEHSGRFVRSEVDRVSRDSLPASRQMRVASVAVWNRRAYEAAKDAIAAFQPDVMHAHKLYPQLSVAPLLAASRAGTPVVQTIHDYEFVSASPLDASGSRVDRDELRPSYRALNTALFQVKRRAHVPRVAHWVAVSEYVATVYRRHGVRSTVIPHFVLPQEPGPVTCRSGVVFAGRLSRDKGVGHIPELARLIPETRVTVLGDGPLRAWLTCRARDIPGRLEVAGEVPPDEVIERIRRALVVVIPSIWPEPAGLVALEAMVVGTPVIAYARGGLGEYVSLAGGGIMTDPSPVAMADQVRHLLVGPARWAELSEGAQRGVRLHFTPATHISKLERIYAISVARTASHPASTHTSGLGGSA